MFEKVVVTVIAFIWGVIANWLVFAGLALQGVGATIIGLIICLGYGAPAMRFLKIARVHDIERQEFYRLLMVTNAANMLCCIGRIAYGLNYLIGFWT